MEKKDIEQKRRVQERLEIQRLIQRAKAGDEDAQEALLRARRRQKERVQEDVDEYSEEDQRR